MLLLLLLYKQSLSQNEIVHRKSSLNWIKIRPLKGRMKNKKKIQLTFSVTTVGLEKARI